MQTEQDRKLTDTLRRLGFSDMEAGIYVDLLRHPGSTGYRIGRSIRKPHANVYQALVALEQKGAVVFEEGETRIYDAVAPTELIENLRSRYEQECAAAETALRSLEAKSSDEDRFFRLTSPDQVYARARNMIRQTSEAVLVEAFPMVMQTLRPDLEEAVERGIAVAGLVLQDEDLIEGSRIQVSRRGEQVKKIWRGHQLTLIIDASEFMLALFDDDGGVETAVWARSPFVASILNNGTVADVIIHTLPQAAELRSPNEHVFGFLPPGCRDLVNMEAWASRIDKGAGEPIV
jgi:sugar-specific transcriptional regulator TrmB